MWKQWRNTNYEVSTNGEVRNIKTGRIIKQTNLEGYKLVGLRVDSKPIKPRVHRLVAEVYLANYSEELHVHHINGVRHDNRLENLICTTLEDNMRYRQYLSFNIETIEKVIELSKKGLSSTEIFLKIRE